MITIHAKFKIWKDKVRYWLKVFKMCWFWAYTSRFYTWPENIQVLWLGIRQRKPGKYFVANYYPGDISRIQIVELLVHWSASESMWKAKLKFDLFYKYGPLSTVTMERFIRHFKMWGEFHGWST